MKIADWVQTARTGEQFVYFCGDLSSQREKNPAVDINGSLTYRLYEDGQITLVQRKIKEFVYEYVAIRI